MDLGLQDKRAFVTASTSGIGAEIARRLAGEGCRVLVHGRDAERARQVADGLAGADVVLGDLTDEREARAVAEQAVAWGTEILVNNAGPFAEGTWTSTGPGDWLDAMDDNVATLVRVVQPLLASMTARGWGRIVNVGSRAVRTPLPQMAAYSAAKAAVVNLTGSLAAHLSGTGVTANVVSPGVIATDSLHEMFLERGREQGWGEDWEARAVAEYAPNPTRRLGTPADIAAAVAFLVGEPAGYVNGAEIRVDGGI